jgi:hypothetical protein
MINNLTNTNKTANYLSPQINERKIIEHGIFGWKSWFLHRAGTKIWRDQIG